MKTLPAFVLFLVAVVNLSSFAQIPQKISYQGLLTTTPGTPVADGSYDLKFEIFNLPGGGTLRHSETHSGVAVRKGTFSLPLGPLPAIFSESLYVEVTALAGPGIGSPLTFSPRSELTSAPYALQSASLLGPNSIASGIAATAGGSFSRALGDYSTVSGGGGPSTIDSNLANGAYSTVGGGNANNAISDYSTIGGGILNRAIGVYSTVGGGYSDSASGHLSAVGGGYFNSANGNYSTVGGGYYNSASGVVTVVGGGQLNRTNGYASTVGGGMSNSATDDYATVPGGTENSATGTYSFAAGRRAKANHSGSFVWADHSFADFASTGTDQFLIRASGGVGIGTTSPAAALDVTGNMRAGTATLNAMMGNHPSYSNAFAAWWREGSDYAMLQDVSNTFLNAPSPTGNIFFRANNADKMIIQGSTGNVGIGTTSPGYLLQVGTSGDGTQARANAWNTFSDLRFKDHVQEIDHSLDKVSRLRGVSFDWKKSGDHSLGFIAQEVEMVLPDIVSTDKEGYKSLDYSKVIPVLVEAIKEQQKEIEELRQMIKSHMSAKETETKSMGQLK